MGARPSPSGAKACSIPTCARWRWRARRRVSGQELQAAACTRPSFPDGTAVNHPVGVPMNRKEGTSASISFFTLLALALALVVPALAEHPAIERAENAVESKNVDLARDIAPL